MSLLGFLFERKKGDDASNGVEESLETGAATFEAEESVHGEPNIDQIREELAEIAKLIGPGESYDMLAEIDINMTQVNIPLSEVKNMIPQAFNPSRLGDVPNEKEITLVFSDLFEQLQNGQVTASIAQLTGEVDASLLADNINELKDTDVPVPLQLVLASVRPEELSKRTTKVERDPELNQMPDIFSLPGSSDRGESDVAAAAAPSVSESRLPVDEEKEVPAETSAVAQERSPLTLTPSGRGVEDLIADQEPDTAETESTQGSVSEQEVEQEPEETQPEQAGFELDPNAELFKPAASVEESVAVVDEPAADEEEPLAAEPVMPPSIPLEPVASSEEAQVEEPVLSEQQTPPSIPLEPVASDPESAVQPEEEHQEPEEARVSEPVVVDTPETDVEELVSDIGTPSFEPENAEGFDIPASIPLETETPPALEPAAAMQGHPSLADLDKMMKDAEASSQAETPVVEAPSPVHQTPVQPSAPSPEVMIKGIDINRAEPEELVARFDGIGSKMAVRIVEDREINGRFTDAYDLARVQGIGSKIFESITGLTWRADLCGRREILANILDSSKDNIPDIKGVAQRVTDTKGFDGCVIAHSDGYVLASSWDHDKQEALGAFAPQMYKKVAQYIRRLEMGDMDAFTFFFDAYPITLVNHGDIYLAAIHTTNRFSRRHVQIARALTAELSRRLQRIRDF